MAKPELIGSKKGLGESPFRGKCPLHLPQPIDYQILYDRTGKFMVGMQAKKLFCPNCGLLMELDTDVLEGGAEPEPQK